MEQLRFDGRSLEINYPPNSQWRINTTINGIPHFYDQDMNWTRATIIPEVAHTVNKDVGTLLNGKEIFYLAHEPGGSTIRLYYSPDHGSNYKAIHTFYTSNLSNVALGIDEDSDAVIAIEQTSSDLSRLFRFDRTEEDLNLLKVNSPHAFGAEGKANLEVLRRDGGTHLFSYNDRNELKTSRNFGQTWRKISTLNIQPWDCGLFVSKRRPGFMMIGGIEAYKSTDMGITWTKCNNWIDYYLNKNANLHADIMDFQEVNAAGLELLLVSNHGGISSSIDRALTFQNIGLHGLNASQYYSVRTYPYNPSYILAGSQDQGLQRALDLDEGAIPFDQFIAGDYGHLQFTNYGRNMWAIYPGGWISYYTNPLTGSYDEDYQLLTNNSSVWLPQIMTSPYNPNAILIAGGSLLGTEGSHIIQLAADDLSQLFANQWNFDFSKNGGDISAMAHNPVFENEFYVTTTNGEFYRSRNSGSTFTSNTMGLPDGHHLYGNVILCSQQNGNTIIVGGSGYDSPGVLISYDRGQTFSPMVDGLDPTTVLDLVYDESERFLFAATEAGPYICSLEKKEWHDLSQGQAPDQRFWSVEYLKEKDKVRFGTYGRGIWDFNVEELTAVDDSNSEAIIKLYPNPTAQFLNIENPPSSPFKVFSSSGQLMQAFDTKYSDGIKIDVRAYPQGIYYLIFEDGKNTISNSFLKI